MNSRGRGVVVAAHVGAIVLYAVTGFAAGIAYLLLHKHGLGLRGGWELAAVIFFMPMVAIAGAVFVVLPVILLHRAKGWLLPLRLALPYILIGGFVLTFIWGGGFRIFTMNGAPPLIGWFMLGTVLLGGVVHLLLERWAWRRMKRKGGNR